MKFFDIQSLFDEVDAEVSLLTTFNFDPVFFERRLLRKKALSRAKRTVVFLDAGQYVTLLRRDDPIRWLNHRYLVVPVAPKNGVFHSKVNLLVGEKGAVITAGSANLTRPGCSYNLELFNTIRLERDDDGHFDEPHHLRQALDFFTRVSELNAGREGELARDWIESLSKELALPGQQPEVVTECQLCHTLDRPFWEVVREHMGEASPAELIVVSPFFDKDLALLQRVHDAWPRCKVRLIAQSETSTLDAPAAVGIHPRTRIEHLALGGRRLHAKAVFWKISSTWSCLVGSANFTTAAFDGRNIEAGFLVEDANRLLSNLFDDELSPQQLDPEEFEMAAASPPEDEPLPPAPPLRIRHALLDADGKLDVRYEHSLPKKPDRFSIALRGVGEQEASLVVSAPAVPVGTKTVELGSDSPLSTGAAIRVSATAWLGDQRHDSDPMWVVQEAKLTRDPSGTAGRDRQREITETGEGLAEFMDELAKTGGARAVIEYLRNLSIRFHDGMGGRTGTGRLRVRPHDPFRTDETPPWVLQLGQSTSDLAEAIYEFADRHEKQRLRRHAKRGNINGLENYLDILRSLMRVIFVYYRRGVVDRHRLVDRFTRYVELGAGGIRDRKQPHAGFLATLSKNMRGDRQRLSRCQECAYPSLLRGLLLLAQVARFELGEYGGPASPTACLRDWQRNLRTDLADCGMQLPTPDEVIQVLSAERLGTEEEHVQWRAIVEHCA